MRILFFILLLMFGCDNPLEQDVTDLENRITQLEDELALVDSLNTVMMDSLVTSLLNQDLLIDSLYISQDSYIDSLNTDQQAYIDSLYNEQQIMLENLASTALNAGFVETEVYNGNMPGSWTDLDLSTVAGNTITLALIKLTNLEPLRNASGVFRPNGSMEEWGDGSTNTNGGSTGTSITLITALPTAPISLGLIITGPNGIVEWRKPYTQDNPVSASLSVLFYLNQ